MTPAEKMEDQVTYIYFARKEIWDLLVENRPLGKEDKKYLAYRIGIIQDATKVMERILTEL